MKNGLMILMVVLTTVAQAQHREDSVGDVKPSRQMAVPDPVMIRQADNCYLCTCWDISSFPSKDMQNWKLEKRYLVPPAILMANITSSITDMMQKIEANLN